MAWWRVKRKDVSSSIPFPRVPTQEQISSYIKKVLRNVVAGEFFELETMEVTKTDLDGWTQGAILGTFINEPTQEILGGAVLPLFPNMKHIPLIGEHVLVGEYNSQHYYFGIVNRKNLINENSQPGVSSTNTGLTKYGKTFESKDIRPVKLNEGEIVYNGRFGQSIKLGGYKNNNKPYIKIRCGQRPLSKEERGNYGVPIGEDIEKDGSSIYLLDSGLPFNANTDREKFDGDQINGKKILIKSDGIFISGRDNIKLKCINNVRIDTPNFSVEESEVKLGSTLSSELQPVVKGDDLMNLLVDMITAVDNAFKAAAPTMITGPSPGSPTAAQSIAPFSAALTAIKTQIKAKQVLSTDVKTK